MKNGIQDGKILKVTAAADVVSGAPAKIGAAFGVYVNSALSGEDVPFLTEGAVELPKDASVVTGFGHLLYWDDTAKKVTITATSNTKIGYALEAAATGVATVKMKLVPTV